MKIIFSSSFSEWFLKLNTKVQTRVEARLFKIKEHSHFGDMKYIDEFLSELRWKNGLRIYFYKFSNDGDDTMILILGGNKNGQKKDIAKARAILGKNEEFEDFSF